MRGLLRRYRARALRKKKQRLATWSRRWEEAVQHLWDRHRSMPVTKQSLCWLERNHARLMRVAANRISEIKK